MSYNLKCCSFYPNNFDASALSDFYSLIKCSIIKLEDYKCLVFSPNIPLE